MTEQWTKKVVIEDGERILLSLIRISEAILDDARIKSFHTKTSRTVALKCSKLLLTSADFQQHSLRVYLQVQEWIG